MNISEQLRALEVNETVWLVISENHVGQKPIMAVVLDVARDNDEVKIMTDFGGIRKRWVLRSDIFKCRKHAVRAQRALERYLYYRGLDELKVLFQPKGKRKT